MDNEELDYISSSPLLATAPKPVKAKDELDMPALERLAIAIDLTIASYKMTDRLDLSDTNFSIEQQLAMNIGMQTHLIEFKQLVDDTIQTVKEKYANE